jgi:hypothetical protein
MPASASGCGRELLPERVSDIGVNLAALGCCPFEFPAKQFVCAEEADCKPCAKAVPTSQLPGKHSDLEAVREACLVIYQQIWTSRSI